jgi:hypothetical protein
VPPAWVAGRRSASSGVRGLGANSIVLRRVFQTASSSLNKLLRRVLSEDHPGTLISASNLAADLRLLGPGR